MPIKSAENLNGLAVLKDSKTSYVQLSDFMILHADRGTVAH